MNLVAFNHTWTHKARKFKLPLLEGLCGVLREVGGGAWPTKLDLENSTTSSSLAGTSKRWCV